MKRFSAFFKVAMACSLILMALALDLSLTGASQLEDQWMARPFHFATPAASYALAGYSPYQIRTAYNLPSSGGSGTTIAIIDAYDAPTVQSDLAVFSNQFGLPAPTADNFEVHKMQSTLVLESGWATETALDVEWAHAIAPQAKILLVLAKSPSRNDLLSAVDYARARSDVVSVSMSWGDDEFQSEALYDSHFTSVYGAAFFAASGDNGAGVSWPASSPNVVGVGGTTLSFAGDGTFSSETGWSGSGGGISAYEAKPSYQANYGVTGTKRRVPDISYNANPNTGVAVYYDSNWYKYGGTSAGAPQWAAIHALGRSSYNINLYQKAGSPANASYLRDVKSGSNGAYAAGIGYDLVTGLGSPLTTNFASVPVSPEGTYLTLIPSGQSTPLNSTNQFEVNYIINGSYRTTYASNGTLRLNADKNTNYTVAGASTSSTSEEQWVFASDLSPITGTNMTLYYYNLLAQNTSYGVADSGNTQIPIATYITAPEDAFPQPQTATLQLNPTTQTIWPQRGTIVFFTNPLSANSTQRWFTQTASWNIVASNQIPQQIAYYRQTSLTTTGAQANTQWYNINETAQISLPGVLNRASENGQRLTSYSIDAAAPIQVQPTASAINISVLMDTPHILTLNSIMQHQVSLDNSAIKMLASITTPTISGDSYWYDEGTQVLVALNGINTRSEGIGQRITSYSVDGLATNVATTSLINVINQPLFSTKIVSANLTNQYQLNIFSGSKGSITAPPIPEDASWYDSRTNVTVIRNYSWNEASNGSKVNALGYTIGQGPFVAISRSANGTFPIQITLNKPETVVVSSVTQYKLNVSGGYNVIFSKTSPTGDEFFDSGTEISVTTENMWTQPDQTSRQLIASYTLDGLTNDAQSTELGNLTVTISFETAHTLNFNSVLQYLISMNFTDSSGKNEITPSLLTISVGAGAIEGSEQTMWIENGTQFQISSVVWQNVDVKPIQLQIYVVNSASNQTVKCRIYDVTISAKDYLNMPVTGAQLTVTLANKTTLQLKTSNTGKADIPMIPSGTFNATLTYLGSSVSFAGDAAAQPEVTPKVFVSLPVLGLIGATVATIVAVAAVLACRRNSSLRKAAQTKPEN